MLLQFFGVQNQVFEVARERGTLVVGERLAVHIDHRGVEATAEGVLGGVQVSFGQLALGERKNRFAGLEFGHVLERLVFLRVHLPVLVHHAVELGFNPANFHRPGRAIDPPGGVRHEHLERVPRRQRNLNRRHEVRA